MDDKHFVAIKFDGKRYHPAIKYILVDDDWDKIRIRCGFNADKESLARTAVEYIRAETAPMEFLSLKMSLETIAIKTGDLLKCIHDLKNDEEIYEVLIDDDSEAMPASFSDGEGSNHVGHQRLLELLAQLQDLSNRIKVESGPLPREHRKNDSRNLQRLVASFDKIVTKCSDRLGIKRSKKWNKGSNDLLALQEICSIACKHSVKGVTESAIDKTMRRAIEV